MQSRGNLLVKIGRVYQRLSPFWSFLDYPVEKALNLFKRSDKSTPVVILLAAPRSGSTLTYQILTSGIKNFHLTNIWNLLFATPVIGGLLAYKLGSNYKTSFSSIKGFVPGLSGEAEGLKFWDYWLGQDLEERKYLKVGKLKRLIEKIQVLGKFNKSAFITGYLGHVFSAKVLNENIPNVVFVHLYRDFLSNAHSIFKLSTTEWLSTKPAEFTDEYLLKLNRHQAVAKQVISIHKKIVATTNKKNTINISYEELCADPYKQVQKIVNFAATLGVKLELSENKILPSSFRVSSVSPIASEDTIKINEYLQEELQNHPELNFLV